MKKFEYQAITTCNLNDLNDLGKDGWEMVGCGTEYEGSSHVVYFKREII